MTDAGGDAGDRLRGIGLMLVAVTSMVGVDVTAKWLSAAYSLSQIIFVRGALAMLCLLALFGAGGRARDLRMGQPLVHAVRSLLATGTIFGFFYAVANMPLAEAVTIAFAAPLIITGLSRPVLGEAVGARRWAAVAIGFFGVLVVLRPSVRLIDPAALSALGATTCYAVLVLTARIFRRSETAASLAVYPFVMPTLLAAYLVRGQWLAPSTFDWIPFVLCGVFGALGYLSMNRALVLAPPALLAPFEYVCIVGAVAAGYFIWDEIPDLATIAGATIIVGSGLYIIHRESRRAQPSRGPSSTPDSHKTGSASHL